MSFWDNIVSYFHKYLSLTSFNIIDAIEIVIIAVIFYYLMIWFKKTRAWALFKGILVILIVILIAAIFNFNTIVFISSKTLSVGIIGLFIIFQPELRRALEQLGRRSMFKGLLSGDRSKNIKFSDRTMEEILRAVADLSRRNMGALICIEENVGLMEYENSGIGLDSIVSSQLLENIFEDKTPLHDGAVIIRDDRVVAATCYFPLSSDYSINKKYGTRHRAALGISEVSDAFTIIVSEETGEISIALAGTLIQDVEISKLKSYLITAQQPASSGLVKKIKKGVKDDEQN